MIFEYFWNFIGLLLVVPVVVFLYLKWQQRSALRFSDITVLKRLAPSRAHRLRHVLIIFRIVVISLVVIALMRPQKGLEETKIESEGIDIILAIDVSGSMIAEDFTIKGKRKNRLQVVKTVVKAFVKKRPNDRIGLVVFGGHAYMKCPLTLDHGVVLNFLDQLHVGMIEGGTAVGDGIAVALTRLKKIESESKVIILLTDGVNNSGTIDPTNAAALASALNIKIYAVGAGSKGKVPVPAQDFFGNKVYQWVVIDLDEKSLKQIAQITKGQYFRATDTQSLIKVYDEINQLEKIKVEVTSYMEYKELFQRFVLWALIVLVIETGLRYTRFRIVP
jgi:Ca-activated chloride channel family protein